jgi:hypothetical protein
VCKETGLTEDEVMAIFDELDQSLFQRCDDTRWQFNIGFVAHYLRDTYPQLFSKCRVIDTNGVVAIVPLETPQYTANDEQIDGSISLSA